MSFFHSEDSDSRPSNLPEFEAINLSIFSHAFKNASNKRGVRSSLYLVGGALTKPWPRKDIDVVAVFEKDPRGVSPREITDHFTFCLADYNVLYNIAMASLSKLNGWAIVETHAPELDSEFDIGDSILRHDGSISFQPAQGTQIELAHNLPRGSTNFERSTTRPYFKL